MFVILSYISMVNTYSFINMFILLTQKTHTYKGQMFATPRRWQVDDRLIYISSTFIANFQANEGANARL